MLDRRARNATSSHGLIRAQCAGGRSRRKGMFVSTGAFEPTDLTVIFACACVISVARHGMKVKVVGQCQELGSGLGLVGVATRSV